MNELGFAGFDATTWYGLVGPGKLPAAMARRMNEDINIDYKLAHPEFVRLVMAENIHSAAYLKLSKTAVHMNAPTIDLLKRNYDRGFDTGQRLQSPHG